MSRDKTIVPTGIFDWPRFKTLDTVQRLVYMQLWASRDMMSIGVGLVSHAKLADGSSQAISAIPGILDFISQKGLIDYDSITGEVFIVDWFRFHVFRGVGVKIVEKELQKIESKAIRRGVIKAVKANKNCGINLEKNDLNKSEIDEKDDFPEKSSTCSANTNINNNNNINNNTHPAPKGAGSTPPLCGCVESRVSAQVAQVELMLGSAGRDARRDVPRVTQHSEDGALFIAPPFPADFIGIWNEITLKVPKSRLPTFKKLIAEVKLNNGQPLMQKDWDALFQKLKIAVDDPVAFVKSIQKRGGWDPRDLRQLARPGQTFQEVKQRIFSEKSRATAAPSAVVIPVDYDLIEWVKPRSQDFKNWLDKQRDIVSIRLLETSGVENPGLKSPIKRFFAFSLNPGSTHSKSIATR